MKVVLDSNILISALIHPGRARDFVYLLLAEKVEIAISDYIISEVEDVLGRKKMKNREILTKLWGLLTQDIQIVKVAFTVAKTPLRDPKDHPILKTAEKAKTQYIVTGDDDLLDLKKWKQTQIVKMYEFRKILASQGLALRG